jgi:general secretion pathway protein G
MVATITILLVVAAAVAPMARVATQRRRELKLQKALREIRQAIDVYGVYCDPQNLQTPPIMGYQPGMKIEPCMPPYPKKLENLVEGAQFLNAPPGAKLRLLRRLPVDPMTGSEEWGQRAFEDDPNSTTSSGGANVLDVFTKHAGTALDGSKYQEW